MLSFHGQICYPLAQLAKDYFSEKGICIELSADFVETGGFISLMDCLLQHKFPNDPEVLRFLQENNALLGLPKHRIADEDAISVYERFCKMFNNENM
ncbi:MAG: hypothetical protein IKK00_01315 [Oscillospiraceae bacterium]|nr:hypothetical protein [Oscillospiraceae bacterium]